MSAAQSEGVGFSVTLVSAFIPLPGKPISSEFRNNFLIETADAPVGAMLEEAPLSVPRQAHRQSQWRNHALNSPFGPVALWGGMAENFTGLAEPHKSWPPEAPPEDWLRFVAKHLISKLALSGVCEPNARWALMDTLAATGSPAYRQQDLQRLTAPFVQKAFAEREAILLRDTVAERPAGGGAFLGTEGEPASNAAEATKAPRRARSL